MITPENLVRHELVGLEVKVTQSSNPAHTGIGGRVVDESRNMLSIESQGKVSHLPKDQCVFSFRIPSGQWVRVRGSLLVARPEDRVKKKQRKW